MSTQDALSQISLFDKLGEEEKAGLGEIIAERRFPKDSIVIYKGQISDDFYLIRSGEVKVTLSSGQGPEITLATLGPGEFFGEMALLEEEEVVRSATVTATKECSLLVIRRRDFAELAERAPRVALELLRRVVKRLRLTDEKIAGVSLVDVYGQLTNYREAMDSLKEAYEARLRAAETMFAQTKQSADHIIHDAERSRSQIKYVLGIIAAISTLAGAGIGLTVKSWMNEIESAKDATVQAKNDAEKAKGDVDNVKKTADAAAASITASQAEISTLQEQMGKAKMVLLDQQKSELKSSWTEAWAEGIESEAWKGENPIQPKRYKQAITKAISAYKAHLEAFGEPFSAEMLLKDVYQRLERAKKPKEFELIEVGTGVIAKSAETPADKILSRFLQFAAYQKDLRTVESTKIDTARQDLNELLKKNDGQFHLDWVPPAYLYQNLDPKISKDLQETLEQVQEAAKSVQGG